MKGESIMSKEDLIRKLTSRKFWLAVVALVTGLLAAFKVDASTIETVSGIIMAAASVVAYILAEGMVDAGNSGMPTIVVQPVEQAEDPDT